MNEQAAIYRYLRTEMIHSGLSRRVLDNTA
ncbi:MAG: hypothetical protein XXXJIFNMEKO3_01806 [Candidatus Erwinia impunctatus]|nr:hypothetical protein XXXJIFNMEKO_01806 [Culicoides impunctatus]